jgi:hypothetical protein
MICFSNSQWQIPSQVHAGLGLQMHASLNLSSGHHKRTWNNNHQAKVEDSTLQGIQVLKHSTCEVACLEPMVDVQCPTSWQPYQEIADAAMGHNSVVMSVAYEIALALLQVRLFCRRV